MDASVKEAVVDHQSKFKHDETGVWAIAQLNRDHQDHDAIMQLIG